MSKDQSSGEFLPIAGVDYPNMQVIGPRAVAFGFLFGTYEDVGRIIVSYPKDWDGHFPPAVRIEVYTPASWHNTLQGPPMGKWNKGILKAACEYSGLNVAFRAVLWEQDGEGTFKRHGTFKGDNSARLAQIFPHLYLARA